MGTIALDFQELLRGPGPGIVITGMSIVFAALSLISFCIFLLPRVLEKVARVYPEPQVRVRRSGPRPAQDDAEVAAAIAVAFHAMAQRPLTDG